MFKRNTRKRGVKLAGVVLALILAVVPVMSTAAAQPVNPPGYPTVFVGGFGSWGRYDGLYDVFPYWGMQDGDLADLLNAHGYACVVASVDPVASAWDRACELYAQLTGTIVDYGAAHAAQHGHARFGKDYSADPLMTDWGVPSRNGAPQKINLVCHSFGGATARLFVQLLKDGCAEERAAGGEVSGLFTGGKEHLVHSITTLASPHNGTTLTLLRDPASLFASVPAARTDAAVGIAAIPALLAYVRAVARVSLIFLNEDSSVYDLSPDGAAALNAGLSACPNIYYFSVPTDATKAQPFSAARVPDPQRMEPIMWPMGLFMGSAKGVTRGVIVIDESWFPNDGVVNTVSCIAPVNEPQRAYDPANLQPGIWQVLPVFQGDHAAILGGFTRPAGVNAFYLEHMAMLATLA